MPPPSVEQSSRIDTALATIERLAEEHSDESTLREAQWLANRLASGELTVLIAGHFKRGKSTLVNALLGEEVAQLTPIAASGNADELERALEAWAADESRKWVDAVATILEGSTQQHVDRLQSRLGELEQEVLRLGLQALNLERHVPSVALEAFDVPGISLTREHVVDTGLELVVRGSLGFLPAKLRAGVLRSRLEEAVRERLDARRGRLRHTALRELDRLGRALRASVERRLLGAENAVAAALDEALTTPDTEVQARANDLSHEEAELEELAERLELK